jgi:DNA-binding GntR family transcriptional regulator
MAVKETILETRSLSEQVYRYLCDRIIRGTINYGETLNIKQIAAELSVSPMPVREAIKRLEMEGIVTIKPRATCQVKVPTRKSILNALEMRELFEIHCVEVLSAGVGQDKLERLREITAQMRSIVENRGDAARTITEYIIKDLEFHQALCHSTGNEFLEKMHREINLHLSMNFIYNIAIPPDLDGTLRDHIELVESLSTDSGKAVEIIKRHLERSRLNVLEGKLFASLTGSVREPVPNGEQVRHAGGTV